MNIYYFVAIIPIIISVSIMIGFALGAYWAGKRDKGRGKIIPFLLFISFLT